jgi:hypothetical protein
MMQAKLVFVASYCFILLAGIEAGIEITLGPVWKVETAPKPIFGAS